MNAEASPSLAVLEIASIARGLVVADALVKKARVRFLVADPLTPGKYVLVFVGAEAEVEEALAAGREVAAQAEVDTLLLPHAHPALAPAIAGAKREFETGSIGVLELATVAATLLGADKALKTSDVRLGALHLARGIGGKGYFVVYGSLDAVEAAIEAADEIVPPEHRRGREIIARPHPELTLPISRL